MKIELTIEQLENLLVAQKKLTIDKCLNHTYYYNSESSPEKLEPLPIDKGKFTEQGMSASFPNDFEVLKKYIAK